jgi:hypothetical protein
MQLIQDTFIVEQLQVLNESNSNGPMRIRGVFGRCNEKNNNGRIYPTNILQGQLSKVQPLIEERRLCGELDHPQNDTVKLSNASHLITKLELKGNELIGEAELLKTPAGLTAQALINGGVKIGISSRGMGTLSEDREGNKIVNEDFRLVTFDLVADPSTRGAFPGLSESTESKFVRETQSKLQKEANFLTILEARLSGKVLDEAWDEQEDTEQSELAKEMARMRKSGIHSGPKAPGFLDRQRIKAGKRAEAIGDVQADRIRARGAAGGNVGLAGSLSRFSSGSGKYADKTAELVRQRRNANQEGNPNTSTTSSPASTNAPAVPRRPSPKPKKDPVNPELRRRAASLKSKGNAPLENPHIAGPKSKLPEWIAYRNMGYMLAEAFGLVSEEDNPLRTARKIAASNERVKRNEAAYSKTGRAPKDATARLDPEGKRLPGKRAIK